MSNAELSPIGSASIQALGALPEDAVLLKLENENIQSLAQAKPRDYQSIKEDLVAQLKAYPSFARTVIYTKPVGRDAQGKMQYARGLSIRAAEAIAEAYKYNRVSSTVTPLDEDTVRVEARFVDYQQGRIWQDSGVVSRWYRSKNGKMVRHPEDRFWNVVVKAEVSRRVREVILRSVPPGLRAELMEQAERVIDDLLDDSTVEKIIAHFASKGVTLEQLEQHLGRTRRAGWTKEDRRTLLLLWSAIETGETTVEEAFGQQTGGKSSPTGADGKVSAELLTNPHHREAEAAAREVAAGPNGTVPTVAEAATEAEGEQLPLEK